MEAPSLALPTEAVTETTLPAASTVTPVDWPELEPPAELDVEVGSLVVELVPLEIEPMLPAC